jgi:hypothetical protein
MASKRRLWIAGAVPPVLVLAGILTPAINGPHLWLGIPSLMWWICVAAVSVTVVLAFFERARRETAR